MGMTIGDVAALDRWITGNYGDEVDACDGECADCAADDCDAREREYDDPEGTGADMAHEREVDA